MSRWTQPTLKNRICTYIFTYETIEYKQTEKAPTPIGRSTQGAETYTGWGFNSPEEVCSLHIMVAAQAERQFPHFPNFSGMRKSKALDRAEAPNGFLRTTLKSVQVRLF